LSLGAHIGHLHPTMIVLLGAMLLNAHVGLAIYQVLTLLLGEIMYMPFIFNSEGVVRYPYGPFI